VQAVILAGGLGTRLKPMTEKTPKVLLSVMEKPFIVHLLELLNGNGINQIVLCVGYLGEQVRECLGDGRKLGLNIAYSQEKKLLGTGGALKQAQKLLDEQFLVINGDTYLPIDYGQVEDAFIKRGRKALMLVYDNREDTGVKNNVQLDRDLMVVRHNKDKSDPEMEYVEAGVLVLKRKVLDIIPDRYPVSLADGLYPALIQQRELAAHISQQRFYDIGTLEQLKVFGKFLAGSQR